MRIVHDDLELPLGDLGAVRDLREEGLAVRLSDTLGLEDPTDVRVSDTADVLAEEDRFHLALLGLVHVERLAIEELHVADADVERRHADVHAAAGTETARVEPSDRERRLEEVGDVDAGGDDAAHERALQHAAGAVLVAVHRDGGAFRQGRGVRRAEARAELRREVDVHETGDAEPPEQRAATLRAPDEARAHNGAALDLLVGPDLHLAANSRVLVDDAVVADDAALFERHARLQSALPADYGSMQLRPLADIAVAPHDRAVDHSAHVDGHVVA